MINILIRTHNRPDYFQRCIESVQAQSYKGVELFISCQSDEDFDYAEAVLMDCDIGYTLIPVQPKSGQFFYNEYCNTLKSQVNGGWFFFLDDDDYLVNDGVLQELSTHLTDPDRPIICQFLRGGWHKPHHQQIEQKVFFEGQIGLPCLVLHSKHKNLADIHATESGDYMWIKEVSDKLDCLYVPLALVNSPERGWGQ